MLHRLTEANFEIPHSKKNYCVKAEGVGTIPPVRRGLNLMHSCIIIVDVHVKFRHFKTADFMSLPIDQTLAVYVAKHLTVLRAGPN